MLATEELTSHRHEITLFDLVLTIYRRKRWLVIAVGIGVAAGLALALLMPAKYRAEVRVVPSSTLAPSSELSGLSQLGAAAAELGVNLGNHADVSPLFPEILSSREVQLEVLGRRYPTRKHGETDLISTLDVKGGTPEETRDLAIESLRDLIRAGNDMRSGVTTVSVTLGDPVTAAAVANAAIEAMNHRIEALRSGQAGGKVHFVSTRLAEVETQLGAAETALLGFRERNRQIMASPQLLLEETRLARDVTLNEQMFLTLKTQYELARIDLFRDLPDAVVMDPAYPPAEKASPHRLVLLIATTLAFGFLGIAAIFAFDKGREWAGALKAKSSPAKA